MQSIYYWLLNNWLIILFCNYFRKIIIFFRFDIINLFPNDFPENVFKYSKLDVMGQEVKEKEVTRNMYIITKKKDIFTER